MQIRRKPVIHDAIRCDGKNCEEIVEWMGVHDHVCDGDCVTRWDGMWVILVNGEYVIKPSSYINANYDIVEEWV